LNIRGSHLLLGTGGVGKTAVIELAKHHPARIIFTGRNQPAADEVISTCQAIDRSVQVTFLPCDLTSLESIRRAADAFDADRLDVFVANAGVMAQPPGQTKDGYETQFGVCHVGNSALLLRLLPVMLRTKREDPGADVRFVAVTSLGFGGHPAEGIDFPSLKTDGSNVRFGTWGRYGQAKLANILMAHELARRHPEITSLGVHPGVVKTELVTNLGWAHRLMVFVTNPRLMTPRQGCYNTLWAATGKGVPEKVRGQAKGGKKDGAAFWVPVGKVHKGDAKCWDGELAKRLWEWTEQEVGVRG
jgi:NAD(P)-dependent dehydrogenase (short-subunit alcohol dehydrogenase family)